MSTNQYQTKLSSIIMGGILYYTLYPGATSSPEGWVAVDLRTGQTIWTKNTTDVLKCGQIMQFESPNQRGGIPYLWANPMATTNGVVYVASNSGGQILVTSTLEMFDAMTGNWILNITGVPGITQTYDSSGSMIGYYINNTSPQGIYGTQTLNMWNSTLAIQNYGWNTRQNYNLWTWQPPQGASIPFALGIQWTVPLVNTMTADNGTVVNINALYQTDTGLVGSNPNDASTPASFPLVISRVADVILVDNSASGLRMQEPGYWISEGYSPSTGALVWGPTKNTIPAWARMAVSSVGDGIYTIYVSNTYSFYAYSLATGQKLWGPTSIAVADNPWSYYVDTSMIAYGHLYSVDFGGNVYSINEKTGAVEWCLSLGTSGYQTPYGVWPITNFQCIADGKIYFSGGHLYSPPIYAGALLYCVNATSGDLIWSMPQFATTNSARGAIADGYLVVPNAYDNQIYCYGKGPSKTTVIAPSVGVTTSTPITISGAVTDISAGSQQNAAAMNFPNGLPCVSDASMTQWMMYVYEQQPLPSNTTGVPVSIDVLDSNGNYRNIGTATSDVSGKFSFTWTPDIPGDFTVIASFPGSESYYASYDEAFFTAGNPAPTAAPVATAAPSMADLYFMPMSIAIFIAIIVVGVAIILALRKRP
jgi:outer membrane protein assembly factor BamB